MRILSIYNISDLSMRNNFEKYKSKCNVQPTFKSLPTLRVGENISNIGTVIKSTLLKNNLNNTEKCLFVYQKTKFGGVFRLLKNELDKINELSRKLGANPEVLKKLESFNFYTMPEVLDRIKLYGSDVISLYDELRIAECGFIRINKPEEKAIVISKGFKPYSDDDFIFIEDFYYDKKKGYETSGKDIALPLIEKLGTKGNKNVLAIAQAIGKNSASPINLYLRNGFKLLNLTMEDINKHIIDTPKGKRIDPKLAVSVYLPADSLLYEVAKKFSILEEINSQNSNWF